MKLCVALLAADNYFSWSNDMKVVLRGSGLWKYVLRPNLEGDSAVASESVRAAEESQDFVENDDEFQKRDLALAYILNSIKSSCKSIVRQMRCSAEVWQTLRKMFRVMPEAAIDGIQLKKGG